MGTTNGEKMREIKVCGGFGVRAHSSTAWRKGAAFHMEKRSQRLSSSRNHDLVAALLGLNLVVTTVTWELQEL